MASVKEYDYLLEYKEQVRTAVDTINANPSSGVESEVANIISDLKNAKMSGSDSISSSVNSAIAQCTSTFNAIQASINSTFKEIENQYKSLKTALENLESAKAKLEAVEASKPIYNPGS